MLADNAFDDIFLSVIEVRYIDELTLRRPKLSRYLKSNFKTKKMTWNNFDPEMAGKVRHFTTIAERVVMSC